MLHLRLETQNIGILKTIRTIEGKWTGFILCKPASSRTPFSRNTQQNPLKGCGDPPCGDYWAGTGHRPFPPELRLPKLFSPKALSRLPHQALCWSELDAQPSIPHHFLYPKTDALRRPAGWLCTTHFQLLAWHWENWRSSIWPGLAWVLNFWFLPGQLNFSISRAGQAVTAPIIAFLLLFFFF